MGDPYGFIGKTARRLEADAFRTRLLLRSTICMTGREAAQVFYDPERFAREGAAPRRVKKTLFGEGAATDLLARRLRYDVPDQDLTVDTTRLPALPRSRFVMSRVRLIA